MNHSPQDLEDRADRIQKAIASIQSTIEQIKAQGDIAPPGCCVLRYQARGNKKPYWYYKLHATDPIFLTKSGKMSKYKHLGKAGSVAHIEALMQVNRRTQLEGLHRTLDALMHSWSDLYESVSNTQKSKKKP